MFQTKTAIGIIAAGILAVAGGAMYVESQKDDDNKLQQAIDTLTSVVVESPTIVSTKVEVVESKEVTPINEVIPATFDEPIPDVIPEPDDIDGPAAVVERIHDDGTREVIQPES